MENNKGGIIVLSVVLVASFFLPWLKIFFTATGWDLLFNEHAEMLRSDIKYIALFIPVSGALIFYGSVLNGAHYPVSKSLLFRAPLAISVLIIVVFVSEITGGRNRSFDFEGFTNLLGVGFWFTLVASIVLPFLYEPEIQKRSEQNLIDIDENTQGVLQDSIQPSGSLENVAAKNASNSTKRWAMAIFVVALTLLLVSTQKQLFTKNYKYRVDPASYGLPEAYDVMGPVYENATRIDKEKIKTFQNVGLVLAGISLVVFMIGRPNNSASKPV